MPAVAFASSPELVRHDTGADHPERPDRLRALHRALRLAGLLTSPDPFPDFRIDLPITPLRLPPLIELPVAAADRAAALSIHSKLYLDEVERCATGGGMLDPDTPAAPGSFDAALLALGCGLACCDAVMSGVATRAFAAVRPPGHHAEPSRAMGFCLLSNVAILARHLQDRHGVQRVAIVDFDVHHGNGTQAAFEDDNTVLFISLHQHPQSPDPGNYPGTGFDYEVGHSLGRGYTLNLPVWPGEQAGDSLYASLFDEKVLPKLRSFDPQVLLISAGFDAHRDDPLAQVSLSDDAYETMTRKLVAIADAHCQGRLISILEGGYDLAALSRCVVRHVAALIA
jgi:acetoin utilization deacetylase AcuC-like enzyme